MEEAKSMTPAFPQVDAPMLRLAENQPEYIPITIAKLFNRGYGLYRGRDHNTFLAAFKPDEEQRKRIAEGADVYIALLTYGDPMQPLLVYAGKEEVAVAYDLKTVSDGIMCDHEGWWFLDEAGDYTGPYASGDEAERQRKAYASFLNEGPTSENQTESIEQAVDRALPDDGAASGATSE